MLAVARMAEEKIDQFRFCFCSKNLVLHPHQPLFLLPPKASLPMKKASGKREAGKSVVTTRSSTYFSDS